MDDKNKEKTMKKVVIVSLAIAATVTLGGGAVAFATTQFAPSPSTIEYSTPETEKSTSEAKKVEEKVSPTPTTEPAPVTEPAAAPAPVVEAPAPAPVQAAPAPAPVQAAPAPAPAPVVEDPMTRQWVDSFGNRYVGPNAVSCADGSAPEESRSGFPAACVKTEP